MAQKNNLILFIISRRVSWSVSFADRDQAHWSQQALSHICEKLAGLQGLLGLGFPWVLMAGWHDGREAFGYISPSRRLAWFCSHTDGGSQGRKAKEITVFWDLRWELASGFYSCLTKARWPKFKKGGNRFYIWEGGTSHSEYMSKGLGIVSFW